MTQSLFTAEIFAVLTIEVTPENPTPTLLEPIHFEKVSDYLVLNAPAGKFP
jgi:hypothetical protein